MSDYDNLPKMADGRQAKQDFGMTKTVSGENNNGTWRKLKQDLQTKTGRLIKVSRPVHSESGFSQHSISLENMAGSVFIVRVNGKGVKVVV